VKLSAYVKYDAIRIFSSLLISTGPFTSGRANSLQRHLTARATKEEQIMFDLSQILRQRMLLLAALIAVASFALSQAACAQGTFIDEWTWMGGSNTMFGQNGYQPGVYGTLGVFAAGNIPGGRSGASSWTDSSGNFWLFSGGGTNDLWEFDPATNEWAWMSGNSTGASPGVYGTLGTPAAGNIPGDRGGAATWSDGSGNFWLFGGRGSDASGNGGYLNDLWEFNPSTKQWVWMAGSSTIIVNGDGTGGQSGVYGTLGTPAAGNTPGGRQFASGWTDSKGNLWLFGGLGFDAGGNWGELNDLWKFDPSTSLWAWMGGTDMISEPGVYGAMGTAATANIPGGRDSAVSWADSHGNFWLFGGSVAPNDLWEFNPSTKEWTWMGGSNALNCNPVGYCNNDAVYGQLGTPAAANIPSSRYSASAWTDNNGNFWLFAGETGSGNTQEAYAGLLDDLWEYNPTTNQWTWMGGNSSEVFSFSPQAIAFDTGVPGIYGTQGTPATGNMPGGRTGASSWTDSSGHLWLFAGSGLDVNGSYGGPNDLWEAQTSTTALSAAATPTLSPAGGSYTATQTVTISDTVPNATIYYTIDGTTPTTGSTVYSSGFPITVSSTETLNAMAVAPNYLNSAVATAVYTFPSPAATPTFSLQAGTYAGTQMVTIGDTTPNATIYYTNNGTTPTTHSLLYSGAVSVASSQTLEAIAIASGYLDSAVATAAYTITPANPAPVLSSTSPVFIDAGGAAFALTVNGSGFVANSTVYWGSTALATTYVSATQLTAQVATSAIATAGTNAITVQTPTPGGGTSSPFQFEVDSASGTATGPTFVSTAATVTAGSPASFIVALPTDVESATVSCLNLPAGAACSYSSTTNTVTITTTSATPAGTYPITVVFTETVTGAAVAWILLPILLLPLVFLRRRMAARGVWITACLGLVLLAGAAVACTGCGGGGGVTSTCGSNCPAQTHQVMSSGAVTLTVQ
jgi:hypothetical protein